MDKKLEQEAKEIASNHFHMSAGMKEDILAALRRAEARGIRRAAVLADEAGYEGVSGEELRELADAVEKGES